MDENRQRGRKKWSEDVKRGKKWEKKKGEKMQSGTTPTVLL